MVLKKDTFLFLLSWMIYILSGNDEFLMDLSNLELNTENLKNIHFLKGTTSVNISHNEIDSIPRTIFDGLYQVGINSGLYLLENPIQKSI